LKPVALWNTRKLPLVEVLRAVTPPLLWRFLYRRLVVGAIADAERYAPFYSPWLEPPFQQRYRAIEARTLCPAASCWYLETLLAQSLRVAGEVWEAGVYQGGTAALLRTAMQGSGRTLRLFDSFAGMQRVDAAQDRFRAGDLADTSAAAVAEFIGAAPWLDIRPGWVPATFAGLEGAAICFAHIDLDLYQPILDSCAFIYPRMSRGGAFVFDDYGYASCPGARRAVDEFFADKPERPLPLQTGQAIVIKA
jgi:O-methyltransferase